MVRIGGRLRHFTFTDWLRTPVHLEKMRGYLQQLPRDIKYIVFQTERGPRTGYQGNHLHLQGYVQLNRQMGWRVAQQLIHSTCHIERPIRSAEANIRYCSKEDTRVESEIHGSNGTPNEPGRKKRTLRAVAKEIKKDVTLDEIEEQWPGLYLRHKNKIIDAYIENRGVRRLPLSNNNVHIYTGLSGVGKTRKAIAMYPGAYHGVWPTGGRWWWPNYRGENVIIFDEFREQIKYDQCLKLFDVHPMGIEYKGGNRQNVSNKIIITTIRDPVTWYSGVEDKSELERRINDYARIWDFTKTNGILTIEPRVGNFQFNDYVPRNERNTQGRQYNFGL